MTQAEKAKQFAALHIKGTPLILFNAWDAGTAKVIQSAGAKAIATSNWSVAEAQGFHATASTFHSRSSRTNHRFRITSDR